MSWIELPSKKIHSFRYNRDRKYLEFLYRDGRIGEVTNVPPARVDKLLALDGPDREFFFTNFIEPGARVRHKPGSVTLRRTRTVLMALAAIILVWAMVYVGDRLANGLPIWGIQFSGRPGGQ